ncbi:ABC transporter permease [Entomomonas sp. E2T0]
MWLGLSISALSLIMILLSGLTAPISNIPVIMQYITLLNSLRYAIDFVR